MPYSQNEHHSGDRQLRSPPQLSIVVPCFNEQESLPFLFKEIGDLNEALLQNNQIAGSLTLVLIDDGSSDGTWNTITNTQAPYHVHAIKLSRNFGHQSALLAGLTQSGGDVVISMDADLQDDPRVAIQMIERYRQGDEIVFGVRDSRTKDSFLKHSMASGYYRLLAHLGVELVPNHADYRLMSARARDSLLTFTERNIYLRGLVKKLGFQTSVVLYDRGARSAGESKYNLGRMVSLAIDGVTSFSVKPLRLITVLGFLVAGVSFALSAYALIAWLNGSVIPGWTSIILPIYFLGGAHLVALGVIGEYIGKIYNETKARPQFIVDQSIHQEALSKDFRAGT